MEGFRIVEAITGNAQKWSYVDQNRIGDHICYYSDLRKMQTHYPTWGITKSLKDIFEEITSGWLERLPGEKAISAVCGPSVAQS